MTGLAAILAGLALDFGAPMVVNILKGQFGDTTGNLAESVIEMIANETGINAEDLPEFAKESPGEFGKAVQQVESMAPEFVALYAAGLQGQFILAQAEQKKGGMASAWRWGWMYLLGFFWLWTLIIVPLVNAIVKSAIEVPPFEILLTLTGWFIALYMGGHTIKELGKNAIDAVKSWKAGS